MSPKTTQKASLYVLLLHLLYSQHVDSLSINSPSSSGTKGAPAGGSAHEHARNMQLHSQQQAYLPSLSTNGGQQPSSTAPPPLMTTIAQNNYIDSLSSQLQGKQYQQQQGGLYGADQQRSALQEEQDDSVPTATVNNHSRNNQPPARPSQYVDVAGLVGQRDRNASSVSTSSGGAVPSGGLTAKSRSGLPECATQQVCNAIFVRMNYTQRLCECSSNYNWKCSHNMDPQDGHTIELTRKFDKRIYTQIKTCEPLREVRACKSPTDWTLLALQSERSGKAHYVVVCKCPTWAQLEGPYTHNHPPYANIPGIRVYGMLCAHQTARSSAQTYATYNPALNIFPEFPWTEALSVLNTTNLASKLDAPNH